MKKQISFLEALDDPRLLKPWTSRLDLSGWRVFHAALDGLPIREADRALFTRCTGRERIPERRAAEAYAEIGRRGGKTANMALRAVFECAIRTSWKQHVAPGQQAVFAIIAVNRIAAREMFNYVSGILHSTPLLAGMIDSESKDEIALKNGALLQIRTASFRALRGPSYIGAVLDELAFFRDEETSANPAGEIVAALSPAIIPGGLLLGISSVYNRAGYLWEQHQRYFGQDGDVLVWHADTLTMNPTFSRGKIERERLKDPASAAAEYDSEWRDDVSALYSSEAVDASMVERGDLPFREGVAYKAFVDPSGGRRDSAALAIAHRDDKGRVIVDLAVERRAPHDPQQVAAAFAEILKAYRIFSVTGDRYGGAWVEAAYKDQGIRYEMAVLTASELYLAALPLFSAGSIELPRSDRLRGQLCSLMRRTSTGGRDQVVAGQSDASHSDLANAVIGAVMLAAKRGASIGFQEFVPDDDDEPMPAEPSGMGLLRHLLNGGR